MRQGETVQDLRRKRQDRFVLLLGPRSNRHEDLSGKGEESTFPRRGSYLRGRSNMYPLQITPTQVLRRITLLKMPQKIQNCRIYSVMRVPKTKRTYREILSEILQTVSRWNKQSHTPD